VNSTSSRRGELFFVLKIFPRGEEGVGKKESGSESDGSSGPVAMASYLRLESDVANFSSNLPIVIIENWGSGKPNSDTDGFWGIIEPATAGDNRSHLSSNLAVATRCNMKVRGSSSAGFPKYSLSLESQDEDKLDQEISPLGLPAESDWILSGRYTFDRALMRNPLIYQLSNESGEYAVRTRFVEVFMNTGGGNISYSSDYVGVYSLMEKIKRDGDRVDVRKLSSGDTNEPEVSGGYLWKKDRLDPGDGGFSVNSMGRFGWVYPKEDNVVAAQQTWLRGTSMNSTRRSIIRIGRTRRRGSILRSISIIIPGCGTIGSTRLR